MILVVTVLILIGIPLVGYSADTQQAVKAEKPPLYWVDPMEPNIHYSAPGKSRMGMELVPVYPNIKQEPPQSGVGTPPSKG